MSKRRKIDISRKVKVDIDDAKRENNELRRPQTGESYALDLCEKTDYFCRKCGKMKFRCHGCRKIVCFCEKRNNHMVNDWLVFCLPPLS